MSQDTKNGGGKPADSSTHTPIGVVSPVSKSDINSVANGDTGDVSPAPHSTTNASALPVRYTVCVDERLPRKPYYARVEDEGEYGFWKSPLEAHAWVRENIDAGALYLVPVAFDALCGESEARNG